MGDRVFEDVTSRSRHKAVEILDLFIRKAFFSEPSSDLFIPLRIFGINDPADVLHTVPREDQRIFYLRIKRRRETFFELRKRDFEILYFDLPVRPGSGGVSLSFPINEFLNRVVQRESGLDPKKEDERNG